MKDKVIIFFTRIPALGKTKTRLETFLSKENCVKLQTAFIKDIYNNIKSIGIDIIINYSDDGDLNILKNITDKDTCFFIQEGKDLGEKMNNAFLFALKSYKEVVLIGSDLPFLSKDDIIKAFKLLEKNDIVVSPTYDGGYYLIGMKDENNDIFNIKYSTSSVFQETIDKIKSMGKSYGIGNIQLDIDDEDDFLNLYKILQENSNIPCPNTRYLVNEIMSWCEDAEN
jgi:rSAM/selenodomain-associated transferase 1